MKAYDYGEDGKSSIIKDFISALGGK